MKFRTQILLLALLGLLMAGLVGGIGLWNASKLSDALDESTRMGKALEYSQDADMMHDAIRADVLLALLGALSQDPTRIAEAEQGLSEHGKRFEAAMSSLKAVADTAQTREALARTTPLVSAYLAKAAELTRLAATDGVAAQARISELQQAFSVLETQMEQQAQLFADHVKEVNDLAHADANRIMIQIAAMMALALVVLVAVGLWVAARLTRPMQHAVAIAHDLSQGQLSRTVTPEGNLETLQLLSAMSQMQNSIATIVRSVKVSAERPTGKDGRREAAQTSPVPAGGANEHGDRGGNTQPTTCAADFRHLSGWNILFSC